MSASLTLAGALPDRLVRDDLRPAPNLAADLVGQFERRTTIICAAFVIGDRDFHLSSDSPSYLRVWVHEARRRAC
ncbi:MULTISPECIES: hypothetical protein [Mycolicibacter]|uniref:Uncharacterized protein n=2 Tax=Mycolicibacter TaxID=1073531 RepID=A0ABU5XM18_9MYCO|nr:MULTISPECIES: hypothetical protein [unclassified Mycolicibacter]MEB3023039.1 hypothetical protein [Mycolicibacter sp. MYC098]MEB3033549.1 hypothetical protein [Mycolicibacter sp. MYC340]